MIIGLGTDVVEIERFEQWVTYDQKKLEKIFTPQEIGYCLANPIKSAERFAARFAAKEAFFKAASSFFEFKNFSVIAKFIEIAKGESGAIFFKINWAMLQLPVYDNMRMHLSVSHTQKTAFAIVILEIV